MKSFLRDNPTLVFGLALPLILVVLFLIASGLPRLYVAAPKYDVIYATHFNDYTKALHISVKDQTLEVMFEPDHYHGQVPKIWRYSASTGALQEISINLPSVDQNAHQQTKGSNQKAFPLIRLPIQQVANLVLDSASIAPDGYEFSAEPRGSGSLFTGWFRGSRYHYRPVLHKDGRRVRLPKHLNQRYGRGAHFIAWVVSDE